MSAQPATAATDSGAYADNAALQQALRTLADNMIELALLARQAEASAPPEAASGAALERLYRQASQLGAGSAGGADAAARLGARIEQQWQLLGQRAAATVEAQIFIPWIHVCALFNLDRPQQEVLLFGLLSEIEWRYGAIVRAFGSAASAEGSEGWIDLAGLDAMLAACRGTRPGLQRCLLADAALLHWELIVLAPNTSLAGLDGGYRLSEPIAAYLLAQSAPRLCLERPLTSLDSTLALDEHLADAQALAQLARFIGHCGPAQARAASHVLQLQGPDLWLARSLCAATFATMGMACVELDGKEIWQAYLNGQKNRRTLLARLRLLCRDALLCNRIFVLLHCHWLGTQEGADDDLLDEVMQVLFESQPYLAVLNGPARRLSDLAFRYARHEVAAVLVRVPAPDSRLRRASWLRHAGTFGVDIDDALLARLVNQYLLTQEQIVLALKETASRRMLQAEGEEGSAGEMLLDACRAQSNREQMSVAHEVKTTYRFGDIVLPDTTRQWLQEVLQYAQQRHQVIEEWGFNRKNEHGSNLCILFYGPSGTGKTMAASIIANELGLGLYRIDLASIVSKYIGETEKHLAQLFDQAEAMNIVLFFDEAESLFSKRTETKDAHDRYANLQTGYLLQRIESYTGIVILSTNLMANMDKAFTRRFKFMIEYPFPGGAQRLQLWRSAFPPAVPLAGDIDFELLAERAPLSGANINSIAVNAAFLAAAEQQAVGQRHLLKATEREYHKLGKVFAPDDFRWDDDA
ncbi:ATP-binding protein [Janthinobacterium lividum]|uniref:ATP-binding protein n=1 Tax=Janthinobacterium lividum TaxID=29581 RepID=UPI0008738003|nr:ATP-binding protein [Janthinobacterium lividum]MCC7712950.1 ATP-binding protein [Janthinobacterium lividum]OEZ55715.1 ATP-dependent zinc metalloprotease FtsH [Janthinobacterium lividum]WQE31388.1 ATP-binding protein [Janthinobacterium lividum]STQ96917.1 ATP-dependent zinc metalloprotease FtsH 3 [Janthinobacterium lividum]